VLASSRSATLPGRLPSYSTIAPVATVSFSQQRFSTVSSIQQQITPIKIDRGYTFFDYLDWSVLQSNARLYDLKNQGTSSQMRQIAGLLIDNSLNTNSIIITVIYSGQRIKLFGGEVATLPIITDNRGAITIGCNNDVTPNVGTTFAEFTDFDLGFNIAQTGSGGSIVVQDNQLYNTLQAFTNQTAGSGGASKSLSISSQVVPSITTIQRTVGVVSNNVVGVGLINGGWYIQNIGATTMYINFGNTSSATNGSYQLAAGLTITSATLFGNVIAAGSISAASSAAGGILAIGYW
jgi:hypothetical protein